jgi:hypothetical protein
MTTRRQTRFQRTTQAPSSTGPRPPTPRTSTYASRGRGHSPSRRARSASRDSTRSNTSQRSNASSQSRRQGSRAQGNTEPENIPAPEQPTTEPTTPDPTTTNEPPSPRPAPPDPTEPAPTSDSENQTPHSRPPTPNWTGFTPQPDFQQAREHEREINEEEGTRNNHSYFRQWNRDPEVPMEPLSIDEDWYLDYRDPQNVKFFNKGSAKLQGDQFSGKNIFSWLRKIELKANEFRWISTLTINGKLLTTHYAELSILQVREAAQQIQDEGQRRAQNSRMMFYCFVASITQEVMDKVILKKNLYTLQARGKSVEDGICFLKVIIDSYYANTRTTTMEIRKQLANLPTYMQNVARGDVTKLCQHARMLNAELEAAGEKTLDLVANLLAGLERTPDVNFQRWLANKRDRWVMKEIDWREDGTDLMDEAESFYLNLKNSKAWGQRSNKESAYALQATAEDEDSKPSAHTEAINTLTNELRAFTAQMSEKQKRDEKYKWKLIPPKDGESTTKRVLVDGERKKYHWCVHHKAWTLHSPTECKRATHGPLKKRKTSTKDGPPKKTKHKDPKKIFNEAKIAFEALALIAQTSKGKSTDSSEAGSNTSNASPSDISSINSNKSQSTSESYQTAEYDTDES